MGGRRQQLGQARRRRRHHRPESLHRGGGAAERAVIRKVALCGSSRDAATAVLMKDGSIWTAGNGAQVSTVTAPPTIGSFSRSCRCRPGSAPPRHCGPEASTRSSGSTATTATPMPAATTARASSASQHHRGYHRADEGRPAEGVTARMISTGGAYAGAHYHSTVMLGSDGRVYTCGPYGRYGAWVRVRRRHRCSGRCRSRRTNGTRSRWWRTATPRK